MIEKAFAQTSIMTSNSDLIIGNIPLDINIIPSTDWNLILATLFLGFCAIAVPWIQLKLQRRLYEPKLDFSFSLSPPYCHKTWYQITEMRRADVYFFRFKITNTGKSMAKKCEVVLERIYVLEDEAQKEVSNFSPGNLKWVGEETRFADINPGRSIFCDMGHIASRQYQLDTELLNRVSLDGAHRNDLCIMLELSHIYNAQPNCLHHGNYILDFSLYSENANKEKIRIKMSWSGNWKDNEKEMFKEISIMQIDTSAA